jgi:hypothetical protein
MVADVNGAVAVFAPSSLAFHRESMHVGRGFYGALANGTTRLGDAVLASLNAYASNGSVDHMLVLYNTLGDPATRLGQSGAVGANPRASSGTTYEDWAGQVFTPVQITLTGVDDPDADPDGDGVINFLEYAFLLDPHDASDSGFSIDSLSASPGEKHFPAVTLRFPIRAGLSGITYAVELCSNLGRGSSTDISDSIISISTQPLDEKRDEVAIEVGLHAPLTTATFLKVKASM